MNKKFISFVIIIIGTVASIYSIPIIEKNPTFSDPSVKIKEIPVEIIKDDQYMYDRTVKLYSDQGSCSGIQVKAPSGKSYILTAKHCSLLVNKHKLVKIELENGKHLKVKFIKVDKKSDLMILVGIPKLEGINIAKKLKRHDEIYVYSRGAGLKSYKTSAMYIQAKKITTDNGVTNIDSIISSPVSPGASGGGCVNKDKELMGIVSAGDTYFTVLVTSKDIKHFLKKF